MKHKLHELYKELILKTSHLIARIVIGRAILENCFLSKEREREREKG